MRHEQAAAMAEIARLARAPERLADFTPAVRCLLQSIRRDMDGAWRRGDLLAAEDWRRCLGAAQALLQAADEALIPGAA